MPLWLRVLVVSSRATLVVTRKIDLALKFVIATTDDTDGTDFLERIFPFSWCLCALGGVLLNSDEPLRFNFHSITYLMQSRIRRHD